MFSRLLKNHIIPLGTRSRTCNSRGYRTKRSGASKAASTPEHHPLPAPSKVLETFKEEFVVGSHPITIETGKIARFANGAAVLYMDDSIVLSTVTSNKEDCVRDFLPLTVDYQEKQFARGVIPGSFMRREGPPKERELLCGRIIDRPIRPLFPSGFYNEVQVTASVLSSDGKQDPDVMAANATSAALMLSDIPWKGPIGVVRLGRIDGKFVVNPSMDELQLSDLNLVYACTEDKTLMIDAQAREITERDFDRALRFAHKEAVNYLEPQRKLAKKAGKSKRDYKLYLLTERMIQKVSSMAAAEIEGVFTDPSYGKFERGQALSKTTQDVKRKLSEEGDEETLKFLPKVVDTVRKQIVRKRVIKEGLRVDGRRLDEVRPLYCETGNLPILHGSSIFSRGDTQVLCAVTLGALGDAQQLQSLVGPSSKRFMLHYSFPPFSIDEVGKHGGLNRREIGHGNLAEKALLNLLPRDESLPYTIRINSEVMASDGSTSMASVCGGSMALMDAGIQLRSHVAGISVGLVSETDSETGEISDYRILTDILGLEDHLGDMDFKIAGTRNGITAIQLDIKPAGIPLGIICECLEPALKGRLHIIDCMERVICNPRSRPKENSPQIATFKYSNESLRRLIGPLGVLKAKIEEETGARLSISDELLTIIAKNQSVMEMAREKVDAIVGGELEVGRTYKGTVTSIKEYGAFLEFNGGQQGLLHISEMSYETVSKISDIVSVGQRLSVMCVGQDIRGNVKLSLKATLPNPKPSSNDGGEQKSVEKNPARETSPVSSSPAVIVRSVEECDEIEVSEQNKTSGSPPKKKTAIKKKAKPCQNQAESDVSGERPKPSKKTSKRKGEAVAKKKQQLINKKELKIGTKVDGRVSQVRTHGLVVDLGGEIRGMCRLEGNMEKYKVGDAVRVCCQSFTDKGIPVVVLED